jgi:TolA-binding protein
VSSDDPAALQPDENTPDLEARVVDLEQRIEELSWRVDRLARQVAKLSYQQKTDEEQPPELEEPPDTRAVPETQPVPSADGQPAPPSLAAEISAGMSAIIRLIARGEAETAQQKLHKLPEEELARQPAVVALVAAALFVERGDYSAGLKAVARARQLTNDPRLVKLTQLIERQAGS